MRRLSPFLLCLFLLLPVGCDREMPVEPGLAPEDSSSDQAISVDLRDDAMSWALAEEAAQTALIESNLALGSFEREELGGGLAHYSFILPVGNGPYEAVRLHRVIKESRPYRPIRTEKNVFCLHGSPGCFETMFLFGFKAPNAPDDLAVAIYLAERDVDVWGIDQAYGLVPAGTEDLSFMDAWGQQFDIDNLRKGLAVARVTRALTGSGFATLNLLGYSTGLRTGFATLNHEAALAPVFRHISGFVPVDGDYMTDDPDMQALRCMYVETYQAQLDAGIYTTDYGILFQTVGILATSDPEGPSPLLPGLDNYHAALTMGSMTWLLGSLPYLHFFAGVFDETGMPVDLQYTEVAHFFDFLQMFPPYTSIRFELDQALVGCGAVDTPFDDHLAEIEVPILLIGAAGGLWPWSEYTTTLVGSDDVTVLSVQFYPPESMLLDFGHVDLFTAGSAEELWWGALFDWIDEHSVKKGHGPQWHDEMGS